MSEHAKEIKAALRLQIRRQLKELSPAHRFSDSAHACARLHQQPVWQQASAILFYRPLPDELDIWPLAQATLAAGKIVALPRFDSQRDEYAVCQVLDLERDLTPGAFGVREPHSACPAFPLNRLDFLLVPGLAFTLDGRRLGRGKGFFDRLLAAVRSPKCGVGYDQQIVDDIPVEPHDIRLDWILTPSRWCVADPCADLE